MTGLLPGTGRSATALPATDTVAPIDPTTAPAMPLIEPTIAPTAPMPLPTAPISFPSTEFGSFCASTVNPSTLSITTASVTESAAVVIVKGSLRGLPGLKGPLLIPPAWQLLNVVPVDALVGGRELNVFCVSVQPLVTGCWHVIVAPLPVQTFAPSSPQSTKPVSGVQ